jgi:hypothetical protein
MKYNIKKVERFDAMSLKRKSRKTYGEISKKVGVSVSHLKKVFLEERYASLELVNKIKAVLKK